MALFSPDKKKGRGKKTRQGHGRFSYWASQKNSKNHRKRGKKYRGQGK